MNTIIVMNKILPRLSSLFGAVACGLLLILGTASGWADDTAKTFKIGPQTAITLDGQAVSADQLKVGMRAYVQPDSFQEGYALSIDAQTGKGADNSAKAKAAPTDKNKPAGAKPQNPTITAASATSITITMQ